MNSLGVELGNLWFTLDDCEFLYFDQPKQGRPKPTKADITEIAMALHWVTHHYIQSLEKTIMQLPDAMREKALDNLGHTSVSPNPGNDLPPWSPIAKDCADAAQLMENKPKDWKTTDPAEKRLLEKCLGANPTQSKH
jgi:hypothetical protein